MIHQGADAGGSAPSSVPDSCPVCLSPEVDHFQTVGERVYGRCGVCEATFLNSTQFPTPQQERARYESHQNAVDDPGYRRFLDRLAAPMTERLPPQSRGLDFGCGPGPALAHMMRDAGHRVSCYDPFFAPDTAVLGNTYDFITATEVVEHLHAPASTFELLDSLMRPGALLGVMTEFLTDDSRFAGWYYRNDISHVVFYTARTLKTIAERMGWEVEIPRKNVAIFSKPVRP